MLTAKQSELLRAIHDFTVSRGYSPTVADLSPGSTATTWTRLLRLRRMGLVTWNGGRTIRIATPYFVDGPGVWIKIEVRTEKVLDNLIKC